MLKQNLLILICGLLYLLPIPLSADAPALIHGWSNSYIGVSGHAITTDGGGNVIVTGNGFDGMDLGGGPITGEIYIAKYDPAGTHIWSRGFPSVGSPHAFDVAVDGAGNVVVTGLFRDNIDFGGGLLTGMGEDDIYLAKFDADGNHLWSQRFGDINDDVGRSVTFDASGNVILTGYFRDTLNFGGGTLDAVGYDDIYVVKFDPAGNHLWSQQFGGLEWQYGLGITTDSSDNLILTGYFNIDVNFGGGTLTCAGIWDIYIAKFDAAGNHLWSKRFGDADEDVAFAIATDSSDNVIITGWLKGTVDFGGGVLTSAGNWDVYVAKFDAAGNHLWSNGYGGTNYQYANDLAVDGWDNVTIIGETRGSASFGGGTLVSGILDDIYVARYDAVGNHIWSDSFGNDDWNDGNAVTSDPWGNVIATGDFHGTVDFGGGPLPSGGYVAKFTQPAPRIACVDDVPGDQGGWVNLCWDASGADTPTGQVTRYTYWRAIQPTLVSSLAARGASLVADPSAAAGNLETETPLIRLQRLPGADYYWYLMGSIDAHFFSGYSAPIATLFDSTAVCADYHYFQVIAHTDDPSLFWVSPPDSGYSVDNLSPAAPLNFAGAQTQAHAIQLTWDPNAEDDLSHYAVHRGAEPSFTPNTDNLIGEPQTAELVDDQWRWDAGYYYKVAAVDAHDNKSEYAALSPDAVSDGGSPVPAATYLGQNYPNPFRRSTKVVFGLAEAADVSLKVYDVSGRLVRVLVDGNRDARAYAVDWDGTDARGARVASGVYFYHLKAGDRTHIRKAVLLR